jgi:protein-tyrosine phosphatase
VGPLRRRSGCDRASGSDPVIDLHCHILPGLDDGARDIGDAIEMAGQAAADGISAICATPHIRPDHPVRIDELPERLAELSQAIAEAKVPTRVLQGGELAASLIDQLDDVELRAMTLGGGGRWLLLEPAPGPLDDDLDRAVGNIHQRGFRALIAHPERHLAADLVDRLTRLTAQGALVQATAASFTDRGVRDGMIHLAEQGVIHVLGSDAHSAAVGRPVALAGALEVMKTVDLVRNHLDWIARTAPAAIVAGQGLRPPF